MGSRRILREPWTRLLHVSNHRGGRALRFRIWEKCPQNASLQVTLEAPWVHLTRTVGALKSWACRGKHSFLSAVQTELLLLGRATQGLGV